MRDSVVFVSWKNMNFEKGEKERDKHLIENAEIQ
jgi:hypothetical protein